MPQFLAERQCARDHAGDGHQQNERRHLVDAILGEHLIPGRVGEEVAEQEYQGERAPIR